MKKKVSICLIIVGVLMLSIIGCNNVKKNEIVKLKLAEVTHSVFYAPQYVAITEGYFKDEGINIELITTQGADKTMAALVSGEADIGLMGPEASIYVYNKNNKDYAINFAQLTKRDGSFIISRSDDKDFKLADLKGKEILGGRKGGLPEMTLEYAIKSAGLKIGTEKDEVNVRTDIQFNVMAGAFVAGEGDYVTLFDPAATSLENEGKGYVVASVGELSGEIPFTAYSATKSFLQNKPEIIQKFTNAIYKGQKFIQNNSEEKIAEAIAPFFTDMSNEDLITVVKRYKSIDAWCQNPVLKEDSLNRLMDVMNLAGELDNKPPYEKIVTTSFAKEAMKNIK